MMLVDNGNYRESRWFTAWTKVRQVEEYYLPRMIQQIMGQVGLLRICLPLFIIIAGMPLTGA